MKLIISIGAIVIITTVLNVACTKKNAQPDCNKNTRTDCGCDAPELSTIADTSSQVASISYCSDNSYGTDFKNKYMIAYTMNDGSWVYHLAICNEDILPAEVLALKKNPSATLQVKFAGHLKPVCNSLISPPEYVYANICLTKIVVIP